jgi:hypothetical protein
MIAALLAAAQLPAVLGLQLGAPISLPTCKPRMIFNQPAPDLYLEDQPQTCQTPVKIVASWYYPQGSVIFPIAKMPEIMGYQEATTFVVDGNLEGLSFTTLGPSVTDGIIRQLSDKFGKPTFVGEDDPNPRAHFTSARQARWEATGYWVEYHNMGVDAANGWVRIETDKARAMREQKRQAEHQERTPL